MSANHHSTAVPYSSTDRRTLLAGLVAAALAPGWQFRTHVETEATARERLARCAVQIADAILAEIDAAKG